jgi:hypothetical protein
MPLRLRILVVAVTACAILAAAGPASAATVLSVGPDGVERVSDPFAPGAAAELVPPRTGGGPVRATAAAKRKKKTTKRGQRAVAKALSSALAKRQIPRASYDRYRASYSKARKVRKRLKGLRGRELGAVIAQLEGIALRKQLTASRMPALFLILGRNTQFWPSRVIPTSRSHIKFKGSELIWEYYRGSGIQLQPLVNFKQANNLHGACVKPTALPCKPGTLRKLLKELLATSSRRGGFLTWEYYFPFGGGQPPWMSGMAQSVAIVALGRASQLFSDPSYLPLARAGFKAFTTRPPTGVMTTGFRGGTHYLQYSFAPRSYIFNAFTQAELGLFDFAELTGDATARRLFEKAEPELRAELPYSDIGDWSTYEYRGPAADQQYHELLRELLRSSCDRFKVDPYCNLAKTYRRYQTEPGVLKFLGPQTATKGKTTRVRFSVSKLSAVQITITKEGKTALDKIATFRRGNGSFAWKPRSVGPYTVRLGSKELRTGLGLKTKTSGTVEAFAP